MSVRIWSSGEPSDRLSCLDLSPVAGFLRLSGSASGQTHPQHLFASSCCTALTPLRFRQTRHLQFKNILPPPRHPLHESLTLSRRVVTTPPEYPCGRPIALTSLSTAAISPFALERTSAINRPKYHQYQYSPFTFHLDNYHLTSHLPQSQSKSPLYNPQFPLHIFCGPGAQFIPESQVQISPGVCDRHFHYRAHRPCILPHI